MRVAARLTRARAVAPRFSLPEGVGWPIAAVTVIAAGVAAYVAVDVPTAYRVALTAVLTTNFVVMGMKWPGAAAVGTLVFLPFLGLLRRLLIADAGWSETDPLLLVGPLVAVFLCMRLYLLDRRSFPQDTLGKLVLALLIIAGLEAFNPFGGAGPVAGLGGLIFLGVPLLWFFLGRELATERVVRFLGRALIVVALVVAAYGYWQTEVRPIGVLPPWDQDWYDIAGYDALGVSEVKGEIRAFGTFASNGEYATFLSVGLIFSFAMVMYRRFLPLLVIPPVTVAMFYAGGRAVMALTLMAVVVLLGVRTRNTVATVLIVVVGFAATYGLAATVGPRLDKAASLSGGVSKRNVNGLLNPLDPSQSTFLGRWEIMGGGIVNGFKNPLGGGTAATNQAGGGKLSKEGNLETDNDISDVFVSFGPLGGIIYLAIVILAFRRTFSNYVRRPSWTRFAVAGLLIVMFGAWLQGGYYALAPLLWFMMGWATRPEEEPAPEPELQPGRQAPVNSEAQLSPV